MRAGSTENAWVEEHVSYFWQVFGRDAVCISCPTMFHGREEQIRGYRTGIFNDYATDLHGTDDVDLEVRILYIVVAGFFHAAVVATS